MLFLYNSRSFAPKNEIPPKGKLKRVERIWKDQHNRSYIPIIEEYRHDILIGNGILSLASNEFAFDYKVPPYTEFEYEESIQLSKNIDSEMVSFHATLLNYLIFKNGRQGQSVVNFTNRSTRMGSINVGVCVMKIEDNSFIQFIEDNNHVL